MRENLDRKERVYAIACVHETNEIDVYLGTVEDFIFMPEGQWELERLHIFTDYAGIKLIGEKKERDTTKLWFTSHIDKLKGIKREKMKDKYKSIKEFKERNFPMETRKKKLEKIAENPKSWGRFLAQETLDELKGIERGKDEG
jgi:hypothetical protein